MTAAVQTQPPASMTRWVLAVSSMDFRADAQLPSAVHIGAGDIMILIDTNGTSMSVAGAVISGMHPFAPSRLGVVTGTASYVLYQ